MSSFRWMYDRAYTTRGNCPACGVRQAIAPGERFASDGHKDKFGSVSVYCTDCAAQKDHAFAAAIEADQARVEAENQAKIDAFNAQVERDVAFMQGATISGNTYGGSLFDAPDEYLTPEQLQTKADYKTLLKQRKASAKDEATKLQENPPPWEDGLDEEIETLRVQRDDLRRQGLHSDFRAIERRMQQLINRADRQDREHNAYSARLAQAQALEADEE